MMMLGLVLTFATVGCQKKPTGVTQIPSLTRDKPTGTDLPPGNTVDTNGGMNTTTNMSGIPLPPTHDWPEDPSDPLKAQTIYFDYDKSAIKTSEQGKLEDVAAYLKSHGDVALRVEGNCDERGTEEYNRSLGERRALAAREALAKLGIDPMRIRTISYGKDKPADPGHDDSAWKANRRDDFVLLHPKTGA